MKFIDLGIDPKTKRHDRTLTHTETRFVGLLWTDHMGKANRISADALAIRWLYAMRDVDLSPAEAENALAQFRERCAGELARAKRVVRFLQNHLVIRHDNIPILSAAGDGGGYWVAETASEAEAFYYTFRRRGMTGLVKASRGKKAVLADIVQQLTFEFESLVDVSGQLEPGVSERSAPIEVVDALLEKMTADPEQFAADLRRLGQKFGSVLLPKGSVEALQEKAAELQRLVAAIGG